MKTNLKAKLIYFKKIFRALAHPILTWKMQGFGYRFLTRSKTDCYLITLPQSGTHWIRALLGKSLVEHFHLDYEFESNWAGGIIDDPNHPYQFEKQEQVPRIQHAHLPYNFLFKNKKVILLIRDLRDTVVSDFDKYTKAHSGEMSFSEFLRKKDSRQIGGAHRLEIRVNIINSFWENKDQLKDLLVIKYEDLQQNAEKELKKTLNFVDVSADEAVITKAVEFSSLENMKKLAQKKKEDKLRQHSVNEGETDRYKDYFSKEDRKYFREYLDNNLIHDFGYGYGTNS